MDWKILIESEQLKEILKNSHHKMQAIFKHSTRCYISKAVKSRLEEEWTESNNADVYLLDLLNYRSLSNEIAEDFSVRHESPQLLLIRNGEVVYHESHDNIAWAEFRAYLQLAQ